MNASMRCALVVVALFASPAAAQDPGPGAPPPAPALSEKDKTELDDAEKAAKEVYRLFQDRRYSEALPIAERVVAVRRRILGPDHPDVAQAMMNVAAQHLGIGQLDKAQALNRDALTVLERVYGPEHPQLITLLNNIAAGLHFLGDDKAALPFAERVVRIQEKAGGTESAEYADRLQLVQTLLAEIGNKPDAAALAERILKLREKLATGENDLPLASARLTYAGARLELGHHAEALALANRALPVLEAGLGRNHPEVALALGWIGDAHLAEQNGPAAVESAERALRIYVGLGDGWADETVRARGQFASALSFVGRYEDAVRQHRLAIEGARNVPHPDPVVLARLLHHCATTLALRGMESEARVALVEAADLLRKRFGEDNAELAANYNNQALLLRSAGAYAEALPLFEHALRTIEKTLGPDHYEAARCANNMGAVLSSLGRGPEAAAVTERSVKIVQKVFGPAHRTTLDLQLNLAALYANHGETEKGRRLLEQTIAAAESLSGAADPVLAGALGNLASMRLDSGDARGASALLDRVLVMRAATIGKESDEYADGLMLQARARLAAGDARGAEVSATEGLQLTERLVRERFSGLSTNQRLAVVAGARKHLLTWLGITRITQRPGYDQVLRFKGVAARAAAAERALARESGAAGSRRVDEVRALEHRLAELANNIPFGKTERAAWQEKYASTAAAREAKTIALARDFAPLRAGLERLDIDVAAVQAALRPGEALVDYVAGTDGYLAFVVTGRGDVKRIPLPGVAEIDAAAREFAERSADPRTRPDDAVWLTAGRKLAERVFEPVRAALGPDVKSLVICPDAALASVPFAALPVAGKPGAAVVDVYDIATVSMAQDLVPAGGDATAGAGALLVGGVSYDKAGDAPAKRAPPPAPVEAVALRSGEGGFPPLPGTAREVDALAGRLGEDVTKLTGTGATESALRAAVRGRRIIHIATHGFVRSDALAGLRKRASTTEWLGPDAERQMAAGYDPMLLAGLAMAGASVRSGGGTDDGVITAAEVSYLDLRGVDLVTLSACQTALGRAESGEGVIGLVQGFQMAGARNVLASLWRVDDEATRLFMEAFYDVLVAKESPQTVPAALRAAARKVRGSKDATGRSLAGPAYWAAFVAYGR